MFGMQELIIILIIVLLLFGGRKIPELFSGLGKGIKSFRASLQEDETEPKTDTKEESEEKSKKTTND